MEGWRKRLTVDEDHVVAFAIPIEPVNADVALVVDAETAADVVATPRGLQDHVVVGSVEIDAIPEERIVGDAGFVNADTALTAPLGVKSTNVTRLGLGQLVVDVEVEHDIGIRLVLGCQSRRRE